MTKKSKVPTLTFRGLNEQGFSLIEVMVSGAILVVLMLGVAYQQTAQYQRHGAARIESQARQTVSQILSRIATSSKDFPEIVVGGTSVTYIGCFSDDGTQQSANGSAGYFATPHPSPTSIVATTVCGTNTGGIEVRVYRPNHANSLTVQAHILQHGTLAADGTDSRRTKYGNTLFRINQVFAASPSPSPAPASYPSPSPTPRPAAITATSTTTSTTAAGATTTTAGTTTTLPSENRCTDMGWIGPFSSQAKCEAARPCASPSPTGNGNCYEQSRTAAQDTWCLDCRGILPP